MLYENEKPIKVTSVVISTQHSKDLKSREGKRGYNSLYKQINT